MLMGDSHLGSTTMGASHLGSDFSFVSVIGTFSFVSKCDVVEWLVVQGLRQRLEPRQLEFWWQKKTGGTLHVKVQNERGCISPLDFPQSRIQRLQKAFAAFRALFLLFVLCSWADSALVILKEHGSLRAPSVSHKSCA